MIFADRSGNRRVRHLEWRIRLMGVGAIVAVAGLYAGSRWMIWVAVAVLVAGMALRWLPAPESQDGDDEEGGRDPD